MTREEWPRARELVDEIQGDAQRGMTSTERSRCFHSISRVRDHAKDAYRTAEALVTALELWPENYDALRDLIALSRRAPKAWDFKTTIRELRRVYRERGSKEGLALLPK